VASGQPARENRTIRIVWRRWVLIAGLGLALAVSDPAVSPSPTPSQTFSVGTHGFSGGFGGGAKPSAVSKSPGRIDPTHSDESARDESGFDQPKPKEAKPSETEHSEVAKQLSIINFTDPDSFTVLVNKERPLNPVNYAPTDLEVVGTTELRAEAAAQLQKLLDAAKANGTPLRTQSGYRSYSTQQGTYAKWVAQYGSAHAQKFSARPGYSEHQTGLAVDLIPATGACQKLSRCVADTPAGSWLLDNAGSFGFILRYEKDTTDITGYGYEPWHFRYVGLDAAQDYLDGDYHSFEDYFLAHDIAHPVAQ